MAPVSAPAPAQASGAGAVRAAEEGRAMRDAKSVAELDRFEKSADDTRASGSRRIAGRIFVQRNGAWVDASASDTLRTVAISAFSDAYFRLLEALPELKPYASALDHVIVGGKAVRIEIGSGGASQISAGEVSSLVKEFRGR